MLGFLAMTGFGGANKGVSVNGNEGLLFSASSNYTGTSALIAFVSLGCFVWALIELGILPSQIGEKEGGIV